MIFKILNSAFLRFFLIFKRIKNILILFTTIFFFYFYLIYLSENIFERPSNAIAKISSFLDIIIFIIPVYFSILAVSESWFLKMMHKWKRDGSFYIYSKIESLVCCCFFNLVFLFLSLAPIYLLNTYLNYSNVDLWNYFFSRLLFLTHVSVLISFLSSVLNGRFRFILGIILSFLLWRFPESLVGYFSLSNFFLGLCNILFPYSFSFSILSLDTINLAYLIPFLILGLSIFLSHLICLNRKRYFISIFTVLFFSINFGVNIFFLKWYEQKEYAQIIQKITTIKKEKLGNINLYISRSNIFSQFSPAIKDFENYFKARMLLVKLKEAKIISDFHLIEEDKWDEKTIEARKANDEDLNKSEFYFYLEGENGQKTGPLLGLNSFEFDGVLMSFLNAMIDKKLKIGVSVFGRSWVNENGKKTFLYKQLEQIFQIDTIDQEKYNFSDFDLIVIYDNEVFGESFYQALFQYFRSGGKVIFITDSFYLERGKNDSLVRNFSNAKTFYDLIGIRVNSNHIIIPNDEISFKSMDDFLYHERSLVSKCSFENCHHYYTGIFTREGNGGSFFYPTYFDIIGMKEFSYRPLISLNSDRFNVKKINKDIVSVADIGFMEDINQTESSYHLGVQVNDNKNLGSILLIGDKDIFFNDGNEDDVFNLTGMQILFSGIFSNLFNIDTPLNKQVQKISKKLLFLIDKKNNFSKEKDLYVENIKFLKIQRILSLNEKIPKELKQLIQQNMKDKNISNTSDLKGIDQNINDNMLKFNSLLKTMLRRLKSIRLLFLLYSMIFTWGFFFIIQIISGLMLKNKNLFLSRKQS